MEYHHEIIELRRRALRLEKIANKLEKAMIEQGMRPFEGDQMLCEIQGRDDARESGNNNHGPTTLNPSSSMKGDDSRPEIVLDTQFKPSLGMFVSCFEWFLQLFGASAIILWGVGYMGTPELSSVVVVVNSLLALVLTVQRSI